MLMFRPGAVRPGPGVGSGSILTADRLHARQHARDVVSSGFSGLDTLLPAGGVRRGSLIEWLIGNAAAGGAGLRPGIGGGMGAAAGSGGATFACAVACRLAASAVGPTGPGASVGAAARGAGGSRCPGTIVIVDRSGWFHPPAVLPWCAAVHERGRGAAAVRLIVARPSSDDDELWAIDQALRCPGVAAVVSWPRAAKLAAVVMRRWQLAASASGAVGLIVRSAAVQGEPSWSESRITVTPLPSSTATGSLLERRLLLERVGGTWCGGRADMPQVVEIAFDLARCRESQARGGVQAAAGGLACRRMNA